MDGSSKNDRDFFRIATIATVIVMVIVGGFLGSVDGRGLEFTLRFSIWTIHGAIIGGVLGWAIWKVTRAKAEQAHQRRQQQSGDVKRPDRERLNT